MVQVAQRSGVGLYTPWGKRGGGTLGGQHETALDDGYQPCAGCSKVPKALEEAGAAGPNA